MVEPRTLALTKGAGQALSGSVLIFLLALVPRLAWVLLPSQTAAYDEWRYNPLGSNAAQDTAAREVDDTTFYMQTARSIAQGDGYVEPLTGTPTGRAPPGWPAVLSVFYRLFGPNALPGLILNAVLGAATCVLTYLLGSRLFSKRIGLGAGVVMALFPGHVLLSAVLLTDVAFTFVVALALLLFSGGRMGPWRALLLGLITGAATLVRPEAIFLPILFFAVLLAGGASWSGAGQKIALLAAGMALLLVPWTVRTTLLFDAPVLLTTRTGTVLMVGHGPGASGGPALGSYYELVEQYRDISEPQRTVEIDRAALRAARDQFLADPIGDLGLVPAKLAWLYGHDPAWSVGRIAFFKLSLGPFSYDGILRLADAYYYLVLAGVVLALLPHRPAAAHRGYTLLFGLITLWSFIFGLLFFGDNRYHIPLLPAFSILAVAGYATLLGYASRGLSTLFSRATGQT